MEKQFNEQRFVVMGVPKPQGRPKSCIRGGRSGMYEAKKDQQNKSNIRAQIVIQKPKMIEQGRPVRLVMKYYLPRPKMHFDVKGNIKLRFLAAPHVSKPDCDNLEKAVKDSMSGIVWHDDSQVTKVEHEKVYCGEGEVPHTKIAVITW
jgi:Holliday junction resolvase RusA-like endonuclease